MKTNRFDLRILQNRAGLVPRPSWCSYLVRSRPQAMSLAAARAVFTRLGELDLVRFLGPEPLLRADLAQLADWVLEHNRPPTLELHTFGQHPDEAEAFVRSVSEASRLRVFVNARGTPHPQTGSLTERRVFSRLLSTIERLSGLREKLGFEVALRLDLAGLSDDGQLSWLRQTLSAWGADLYLGLPPEPPKDLAGPFDRLAPADGEAASASLLERLEAEIAAFADVDQEEDLYGAGALFYLLGAKERLRGRRPRPQPKCTALRSHVWIEGDGTVPTCSFRSQPVGNLADASFESAWFSAEAESARTVVDSCSGCWSQDEVLPSALYTGEIRAFIRLRAADATPRRRRLASL